jgi:arylsulfatase A-like enzyme
MKNFGARSRLIPTTFGRLSLVVGLVMGSAFALAGCVGEPDSGDTDDVGSLGFNLKVASNVTLNEVLFSISGNGFEKSGSIDTSGTPTVSGTIGGIPSGKGYTIKLTATSAEGDTVFSGSAQFDVVARKTTSVAIHLRGIGATGNGSVSVNGTLNVAPILDELTVTPEKVYAGSAISLKAAARDPDAGPSALTYYWSTTEGTISDPLSPSPTLSSAHPGNAKVTLTVADGDTITSASTVVTFVARASDPDEDPDDGTPRPNILFIFVDDLGADATSVYPDMVGDSGAVSVPNIEALAKNGLVFDNAWASPVCSPTRGTIISGLYGHRTGVTTVGNVLPTSTVTLFDRLTAESPTYAHALFGKYHVGGGSIDPRPGAAFPAASGILQHVRDLGITTFRGILGGGVADYFNWTTFDINGPNVANTTYATTALTDIAIDHIKKHEASRPNDPWFVYQAYNAPHAANGGNSPYQVPPPELHSVDLSSVGNPAPGTSATNIPIYKANIQALDTEIGRLLKSVDLEKTVVVFLGDNGTPPPVKDTGTGLRGAKGSVYEGGVRVPLIIAGAGVTRRGREDDLFVSTDIYASILELAGVQVSQVNDSYSFKPLLTDAGATNGRTHSFSEVSNGTSQRRYAVKDKRYKFIRNLADRELYDLVADPLETTNLYANLSHAAVRLSLEAQIDALRAESPSYFP